MKAEIQQHLNHPSERQERMEAPGNTGGLLTYLAAVFSSIAQELSHAPAKDCALCSSDDDCDGLRIAQIQNASYC